MSIISTPKYYSMKELIGFMAEPNRSACRRILNENRKLYAYYLYDFDSSFDRPLPFSKSDGLTIMFLHDLEKPWRIEVMSDGTVCNRPG